MNTVPERVSQRRASRAPGYSRGAQVWAALEALSCQIASFSLQSCSFDKQMY